MWSKELIIHKFGIWKALIFFVWRQLDFELKDNSENKKKVDNADGNNHSPNMRKDLNEFTTSPGSEKRSSVYVEEKKLLNEAIEEESKIKNGKSELSKFSESKSN